MGSFLTILKRVVSIVTLTAVVFFVIVLFAYVYFSQFEIQEKAFERVNIDTQKRSMLISFFFSERRNDLETLVSERPMQAYFRAKFSRAPKGVILKEKAAIKKLFDNFIETEKQDGNNIYLRLALLDNKGKEIVDSGGVPAVPTDGSWKFILKNKNSHTELLPSTDSNFPPEVILKMPCYVKDRFAGMLIVFPSWDHIYRKFIKLNKKELINNCVCGLLYRRELLYMVGGSKDWKIERKFLRDMPTSKVIPVSLSQQNRFQIDKDSSLRDSRLVAIKQPVGYSPFFLIYVAPRDMYSSQEQHIQWAILLFVLLMVIIVGAIFLILNFIRGKVLENRLKDELVRKRIVEAKNSRLEQEIMRRIDVEKELKRSKEEAEAANDTKSIFLANMSHELRTPLNGIIGMTELLKESATEQERQELIKIVTDSSYSLLTIINEILDLSKIEAGKLEIDNQTFNLVEATSACLSSLSLRADQANIKFKWSFDENIPKNLVGDAFKLNQVFINLVSNSIKFTSEGYVELKAELQKLEAHSAKVKFSVKDTGIGIPEEKQKVIFDAFVQADGSVTRKYGGTGLGLSISNSIVRMMGGNIELKSQPGKGSEFFFTVTFGLPKEQHVPQAGIKEYSMDELKPGIKILVAEDNKVNQMLVIKLLDKIKADVDVAVNGKEAFEKVKIKDYDIVFMDVQMPEMNGLEATEAIRKFEQMSGQHVPIIAMTANAMKEDREACLAAGMDDFIPKPIKKELMFERMGHFINKSINK